MLDLIALSDDLGSLRTAAGEESFRAAWLDGREMALSQVVEDALTFEDTETSVSRSVDAITHCFKPLKGS